MKATKPKAIGAKVTDTATYPFWAINVGSMEIFAHDKHGQQVGKSEKVRDLQEAFDTCEARNYPDRKGKA